MAPRRNPPLARQAPITVLSCHPIRVPTAFEATESFPPIPSHQTITNKFERSLLRFLHRKTDKVVFSSVCEQPPLVPNKITIAGPHIEIWATATQTASNKPVSHTHFLSAAPHA